MGVKAKSYNFADIRDLLYSVINSEEKPASEISYKSGQMLSVFLDEKNKMEYTENYLRDQENK